MIFYLYIDNEGRLRNKLLDKRDDLNFLIVKFPLICIVKNAVIVTTGTF
jgi:hypothetical protein